MMGVLTEPTRTRSRSGSLASAVGIITQQILCRICDKKIAGHLFQSHNQLCSVKVQWEIRALECDSQIAKVHKRALKMDSSGMGITKITQISSKAKERLIENPMETLENMIQTIEQICTFEKGGTLSLAQDLLDWLR